MSRIVDYNWFVTQAKKHELDIVKLDVIYPMTDTRCWSAVINPNRDNVIVTFNINRYNVGNGYFDILSSSKNIVNVYISDIFETIETVLSDSGNYMTVNIND
ncbi:MAG TPA: hypothetical protein PKU78_06850 [Candidatus Dojkabacteria bacterium]|nr:hypothetical protein [Candidatus Dojkabacteria bacterium]